MTRSSHQEFAAAGGTPPAPGAASGRFVVSGLIRSLRPEQWTKNLFVFAGLIFGQRLLDPVSLARAVGGFLVFCALSGVVYLFNDVLDCEADRRHPLKCRRPIASGVVSPGLAIGSAAALSAASLAAAFFLSAAFGVVAAAYLALLAVYSLSLKHVVIMDVLTIAIGFVLRAAAGAVAVNVPISHWLYVCTILLALFLALAKRRHELLLLSEGATGHRPILSEYSPYLLDQMIGIVTASTLMAYIFYTFSSETLEKFGTGLLGLTVPFPLYGIFRYLYLVHQKEKGGSPAELLITDRPLLACVALWVAAVVVIIYRPFGL